MRGRDVREGLDPAWRLRETHRSKPATGELLAREHRLLLFVAVHQQHVGILPIQHSAVAEADTGLREEHIGSHCDDARQLHTTDPVVLGGGEHPRLHVGPGSVVRALRQHHLVVFDSRLLDIDQPVERCELLRSDTLTGVEHGIEGLAGMLGEARSRAQRVDGEPVVQQEVERATH